MADEQKRGFRRAYLNDFKPDASGKYHYQGKLYELQGSENEQKRFRFTLAGGAILALLCVLLPECLPPVPMSRSFITILPWLFQTIAVFTVVWGAGRLTLHFRELRAYIYEATVEKLPRRTWIAAIFSICTLLSQLFYLAFYGMPNPWYHSLARPLFSALSITICFSYHRFLNQAHWQEKPSVR